VSTPTHDTDFDRSNRLPSVSGRRLLHHLRHPQKYDDGAVANLSIPKKLERLQHGVDWRTILT